MSTQTKKSGAKIPKGKNQTPNVASAVGETDDFWKEKSLDQLAAEQHIEPMSDWNRYFGAARDLWKNDEEFEAFLRAARRPIPRVGP